MALTQMEHFLVLTDDIERTRQFYEAALGMQVGPRPPLEFPGYWMYVGQVPCVHIGERDAYRSHTQALSIPASSNASGTGALDHIAFNANDYDAVTHRLRQAGVHFHVNTVPGIGLRQLFLEDPNGVKLEINIAAASA